MRSSIGISALIFTSSLIVSVPAFATDYESPPSYDGRANNGFGQEKRDQSDGTNPGSFSGGGVSQGGPGAGQGQSQADSKTESTQR
jgi:uncharacterized membrane protein YgcG